MAVAASVRRKDNTSLAFYVARPYWRRGFASEAARAFVELAFSRLPLDRLAAEVQEGHEASVRILSILGFRLLSREIIPANGRVICHYELRHPDRTLTPS